MNENLAMLAPETLLPTPSVCCLGLFDGVHWGHQALLDAAVAVGQRDNLTVIAHTFDRAPAMVFRPHMPFLELTPLAEKAFWLSHYGARTVAVSPFTSSLYTLSGEAFLKNILVEQLSCRHVVVGFHHRFGAKASANVDDLKRFCTQNCIGLTVVPPVHLPPEMGGTLASSSAIREAIAKGHTQAALDMLGHPIDILHTT